MPVIDLGRVIGPQGPQGETGAQGIRGETGLPGPNQITISTATPLTGVLAGNGSAVGVMSVDASPTEDSNNLVTSGGVYDAIDALTAADVGALAEDGTAVAAGKLANVLSLSGSAGWYKFLTITMEASTRQTMIIAVENQYGASCGLLRIYTRRNSNGSPFEAIGWIAAGSTTVDVRWEYAGGTWTFYAYKGADPSGLYFQVLSRTSENYGTWLSELVTEPTTATYASDTVALTAKSGLWFTSVAVSAGTSQQILSISDVKITEDYVLARIEWADPSYITAGYTWTTGAGSFTLSGTATAATTANILLVRKGN